MKEFMNSLIMRLGGNKKTPGQRKLVEYLSRMPYGEVATIDSVAKDLGFNSNSVANMLDDNIKTLYSFKMSHGGTQKRFYASKLTVRNVLKELSKKGLNEGK